MQGFFEISDAGNFRIGVQEETLAWSDWVPYQGVATLQHNGKTYFGVSNYYSAVGAFQPEMVMRVTTIPSDFRVVR